MHQDSDAFYNMTQQSALAENCFSLILPESEDDSGELAFGYG